MSDVDGTVAGMIHVFEMAERKAKEDEEMDPILIPYDEFELPGIYYVSGIAFYPELRG
jgi:hypothetical protein